MRDAAWLSPSLEGGGFQPTLEDTLDKSIHQILSIIHSFNVITAAASPGRRIAITTPPTAATGDQNTNNNPALLQQLLDLVSQQRMEIEALQRQR